MKIRISRLRSIIRETIRRVPGMVSNSGDSDAWVPGHLPNELPKSASLEDDNEIDEVDSRSEGDGEERDSTGMTMAPHLKGPDDKLSLGSPESLDPANRSNKERAT